MCNGITIGGNVSIQISGPCATNGGGALFDNVILTLGTQNGHEVPATIEMLKNGTRIQSPCGFWMIDQLGSEATPGAGSGGVFNATSTPPRGIFLCVVTAGYATVTLSNYNLPAESSFVFVLPDGGLTTPVEMIWNEV